MGACFYKNNIKHLHIMKHFCWNVKLTPDIIISTLQAKQDYLNHNHNSYNFNQFKCLPLSTFPASPWIITTASAWTPSWKGWKGWWTRSCEYTQHRNDYQVSDLSGKHCGWQTEMYDRASSRCRSISDVFTCFYFPSSGSDRKSATSAPTALSSASTSKITTQAWFFSFQLPGHPPATHTTHDTHTPKALAMKAEVQRSNLLSSWMFFLFFNSDKQNCDFLSYWNFISCQL